MSNIEALAARITRLANDEALLRRREQATRQAAIDPILRDLGWDTSNLEEVDSEYDIRSEGKADYSLRHRGDDLVLIEAKKAGESLDAHQDQLLRYAYGVRINLAVLTNGLNWWLYLPRANADWEQRRFLSVAFGKNEPDSAHAAADLWRFLSREKVVSGEALKEAEAEFNKLERKRRLTGALPTAWNQLLTEPDELLVEILQAKTADIVGSQPDEVDKEAVSDFLLGRLRQEPATPPPPANQQPRRRRNRRAETAPRSREAAVAAPDVRAPERPTGVLPPDADFTGRRPAAFWLDGARHEAANWRAVLSGVCELLVAEAGLRRFAEAVTPLGGRKRPYFNRDRDVLRMAVPIAGGDFFIEGNFSANDQVRHAASVLIAVRGPQGADSFGIEPTE